MDAKTLKALEKMIDGTFEKNFIRLFNKGFNELISVRLSDLEEGQEEIKAQLNNLDRKVDRFNGNHEERIIKLERVRKVI